MNTLIINLHQQLQNHRLYHKLNNLCAVRTFMKYHVFAVWDFMSLLKAIQREVTCISLPWTPSLYSPQITRMINEIVLAEESDLDQNGLATSHYELYLQSMKEIKADTALIDSFTSHLNFDQIPSELSSIVSHHLNIAKNAPVHIVASAFFYGRENIIPSIFSPICKSIEENNLECPTLMYYLKRHIELDGDDHGPKALECIKYLSDTPEKINESVNTAVESLEMRKKLWDFIADEIDKENEETLSSPHH